MYSCESLASQFLRPLPLRSKHRGTLRLSVIDLALRGEDGMVASAEVAESAVSSAISDRRPSAVLPIVALPRTPRPGFMLRGEIFFRVSYIYIYTNINIGT